MSQTDLTTSSTAAAGQALQVPVFTLLAPAALPNMATCPANYTPRWPAVQQALQQAGDPGLSLAELSAAAGIPSAVLSTLMSQYVKRGYVHPAGPRAYRRYFLTAAQAQAAGPSIEQAAQLAKQATRQRKRERERAAYVPKPPSKQRQAEKALATAAKQGLSPTELAAAVGIERKNLGYLITRMRAARTVMQVGRGEGARYYGSQDLAAPARQAAAATLQAQQAAAEQERAAKDAQRQAAKAAREQRDQLRAQVRAKQLADRDASRQVARQYEQLHREERRQQRQQQQAQAAEQAAQARKRKPDARTTLVPRDSRPGAQQVVRSRSTADPAPVQVRPAPAPAEVTYAPNYRHTVRKAPPGRFEVAPDERVIGGFSTLGPGQYLPETGFSAYLNRR